MWDARRKCQRSRTGGAGERFTGCCGNGYCACADASKAGSVQAGADPRKQLLLRRQVETGPEKAVTTKAKSGDTEDEKKAFYGQ